MQPPSPSTVRFFDGKKLNAPKSPMLPTVLPLYFAPCACAQSSMTQRLMLRGDGQQPVVVDRMAVKMHADDAHRARRDERFDVVQVHDKGVVNVGEHRPGAEVDQRLHAGKRRVAGHDDFVARPDALELVQQIDDHRPGTAEDALGGAGVRGEFGFKRLRFLAEDVLAGADGAQRGFLDFGVHETFG